jgi:hypothetical protein
MVVRHADKPGGREAILRQYRRCMSTINNPSRSGTPPKVEAMVTRASPFSVEETLEHL